MAIILLIPGTFMGLPPGGHMNPGRNHEAEKSALYFKIFLRPNIPILCHFRYDDSLAGPESVRQARMAQESRIGGNSL
jgi:hypothetical protein